MLNIGDVVNYREHIGVVCCMQPLKLAIETGETVVLNETVVPLMTYDKVLEDFERSLMKL